MNDAIAADVAAVQSIAVVPTILEVVCRTTGMGFAAVARVTEDRWVVCGVRDKIDFGLQPGGELQVETTICNDIRTSGAQVVIDHIDADDAYRGHPTARLYGFQSCISTPIVLPGGRFFGTLCAVDPKPARLNTAETIGMFELFAELIAFHLDAHERLADSAASLQSERRTAELREQFIAVLGHDLRNPLAAIDGGARLLRKTPLDAKARNVLGMVEKSVWRMAGLIDNLLDFARGRLGGGLDLAWSRVSLEAPFQQIVAELRSAHPDQTIEARIALPDAVNCDAARLSQMLSNLLANALTHGATGLPVSVEAAVVDDVLTLSVRNFGDPIAPAALERLFQPFERATVRPTQQGLGLGLYIASEIARAHGGRLDVTSTADETRFTFRMPVNGPAAGSV